MPQPIPLRVLSPAAPPPAAEPFLATAAPVAYGAGFHGPEHGEGLPFRWMVDDASKFRRAFRKWTGKNPSDLRAVRVRPPPAN